MQCRPRGVSAGPVRPKREVSTYMADLLAAALEYAAAGIFVFPARVSIVGGHKEVAPVAEWRKASTTNAAEIRGWFAPGQKWATASVCIDCGKSGIVVIDPDEGEGRHGLANWAALRTEYDIPVAPHAHTPGGGEHWYYREHPRRVVGIDSTGKVAPDVDVRGLGGFVLAWPSEDTRGSYGQIDLAELAAAPLVPDVVIERMTTKATAATAPTTVPSTAPTAQDDFWRSMAPPRQFTHAQAKEFCVPPLEAFRAMRTPEDRGFNQRLNEVACVWSHFVPAFMSTQQAEAELYKAAEENRSVEYQGEAAVRSTIRSGLNQQRDPWKAVRADQGAAVDGAVAAPIIEAPLRRGNFAGVRARKRVEPQFMHRADGKALLYPGKDTYLYAETESGKSWLTVLTVSQCISNGVPVMVVDFEEGDELEYGNRLLDLGMDESRLNDPQRFRYLMVDGRATAEILAEAEDMGAAVVIYEGMSVAYDLYGLQVKENDSATAFRRTLVKPHLVAGRSVLTTDHVVKDRESRGRYAIGGVMKLNAASGGAFLLMNVEGLAPGKRGASNLYVTKDRPGGVKRHGVSAGEKFDPQVRRIGTLVVDDSRSFVSYLDVSILPPAEVTANEPAEAGLAEKILDAVDRLKGLGRVPSLRTIRGEVEGRNVDIADEIERLITRRFLVETRGERNARVFDRFPDLDGNHS